MSSESSSDMRSEVESSEEESDLSSSEENNTNLLGVKS